jgi:hypothetical protein
VCNRDDDLRVGFGKPLSKDLEILAVDERSHCTTDGTEAKSKLRSLAALIESAPRHRPEAVKLGDRTMSDIGQC